MVFLMVEMRVAALKTVILGCFTKMATLIEFSQGCQGAQGKGFGLRNAHKKFQPNLTERFGVIAIRNFQSFLATLSELSQGRRVF